MNERIRITPILLIDENDNKVGEVPTFQALTRARELGLDLVEVAPDARPPVCRIMDYGKFKYEQAKRDKASKAKTKQQELKEVRLGRSMKIDPHDIGIRMKKARQFLMEGHKVQIVQNLRGREMQHKERADVRMKDIVDQLIDIAKLEMAPRFQGRRLTMILGPDKTKIERIRRQQAAAPTPSQPEDEDLEIDDLIDDDIDDDDDFDGEDEVEESEERQVEA